MREQQPIVYVDQYARPRVQKKAAALEKRYGVRRIETVSEIQRTSGVIFVAGGDGTLAQVFDAVLTQGEKRPIKTLGGGTNDVQRKALRDANAKMSDEAFLNTDPTSFYKHYSYRLGQAAGIPFVVDVGTGQVERSIAHRVEEMRGTRHPMPKRKAAADGLRELARKKPEDVDDIPLQIFLISPFTAGKKIYPDQKLHSDTITRLWVEGTSPRVRKAKVILTMGLWILGKNPPHTILQSEQKTSFTIPEDQQSEEYTELWLNGDIVKIPKTTEIPIIRGQKLVAAVA